MASGEGRTPGGRQTMPQEQRGRRHCRIGCERVDDVQGAALRQNEIQPRT